MTATASTPEPGDPDSALRLRLYVAGSAPNSVMARENLQAALLAFPDVTADVDVIDVLQDPERALSDGIVVTPMLVKLAPLPERRVLGNLRDRSTLLRALGLGQVPGA